MDDSPDYYYYEIILLYFLPTTRGEGSSSDLPILYYSILFYSDRGCIPFFVCCCCWMIHIHVLRGLSTSCLIILFSLYLSPHHPQHISSNTLRCVQFICPQWSERNYWDRMNPANISIKWGIFLPKCQQTSKESLQTRTNTTRKVNTDRSFSGIDSVA